jgi:hypothetical protein
MSQEDKPRFSHITVGQTKVDDLPYAEEEEVVAIGAVDVAADIDVAVSSDVSTEDSGAARDAARGGDISDSVTDGNDPQTDGIDPQDDGNEHAEESSEEQYLTAPMPLAQKLVLVACLIGLICTVAFLIWFWITQR